MTSTKSSIEIAGVRLTSPERVLYQTQGTTKRELAEYYRSVAARLLPHLVGRPLTLVRCPRGNAQDCFVQRRASDSFPASLRRVDVRMEDGEATYLVAEDLDGVLELVQLGTLELHTWSARRDRLDRPDRLVFDLDPGEEVGFGEIASAANAVRRRLEELGLRSFAKTTGGRGIHVVAPLVRRSGWDVVREFARAVAEELERAEPDRFLAHASKADRRGRIFIDYLRNAWAATTVAAYSTRARPGATVSVPLRWEEVEGSLDPATLNIDTVPARLARLRRDPWEGYDDARQWVTRDAEAAVGLRRPRPARSTTTKG
jgi:bifunctional non-homologous end joining protein LigD